MAFRTSAALVLLLATAACSSASSTPAEEIQNEGGDFDSADEAVSIAKCALGSSVSNLIAHDRDLGFTASHRTLSSDSATATDLAQVKAIYDLSSEAEAAKYLSDFQVVVTSFQETGAHRVIELFRASKGRMQATKGTFVLQGTAAVVATMDGDSIGSCLVSKLDTLAERSCALGKTYSDVSTWTTNPAIAIGSKRVIKSSSKLSGLRLAQVLESAQATLPTDFLSGDQVFTQTLTLEGLGTPLTFIWKDDADGHRNGAVFRKGTADRVARVEGSIFKHCDIKLAH